MADYYIFAINNGYLNSTVTVIGFADLCEIIVWLRW